MAQTWIEEGRQRGVQQGMQQGLRQGLLDAIELGLELKFGVEELRLLPAIRRIEDSDVLRAIREGIKQVSALDELQRIYRSFRRGFADLHNKPRSSKNG